jgi:hypothetical protein
MNKLTVEKLPTLAEEQLVADELEMFANSMQAFHRKQAHDKVFLRACADGMYTDVRRLLQAKTDANQCDEDGRTALHHAAASVREWGALCFVSLCHAILLRRVLWVSCDPPG